MEPEIKSMKDYENALQHFLKNAKTPYNSLINKMKKAAFQKAADCYINENVPEEKGM